MSFLSEARLQDRFEPFVTFQDALGFIPNLLQAQTLLPRVIEAQAMLERAVRLREGTIPRIQKERILLRIAADRQDTYCMALDNGVLSSLGASDGQIDDLLNDYRNADLSAVDVASLQFCLKLSRHAPSLCWEDIEALRTCGFADDSIFEVVVVTALAVYRCVLSMGLGPEPDFGPRKLRSTRIDHTSVPRLLRRLPSFKRVMDSYRTFSALKLYAPTYWRLSWKQWTGFCFPRMP
jgi:alkylhydroperoxidase family enzyme